ncbi:hypothetical protein OQA88_866 [Cercophora sp. LCS_1]
MNHAIGPPASAAPTTPAPVDMSMRPDTREDAQAHIKKIRKDKGFDDGASPDGSGAGSIADLAAALSMQARPPPLTPFPRLSENLYQESTRFLMEMTQNADDCVYEAATPTMDITYWNGRLRVDYNEVGFTMGDVEAICRIKSTKSASTTQTGEKGIGFKSVFRAADIVSVLSGNYSFRFDATQTLGMITPEWADFPGETRDGFTSILLQIRDEADRQELVQDLKKLDPKLLLFLRRLRRINVRIDEDGSVWTSSLRRTDNASDDKSRLLTTLTHNDEHVGYWVYRHIVTGLPPEPKRVHCTESVLMLAFPIKDSDPPSGIEPVVAPQQVYAALPIRDYGFKFVINADFLLIANRQDIVKSSKWNQKLRDSVSDAFCGAVQHLNAGELRYTWSRYLPGDLDFTDFFQPLTETLTKALSQQEILESAGGAMVAPSAVRYVRSVWRARDNTPLVAMKTTGSKYLSPKYGAVELGYLAQLGVRTLTNREFLEALRLRLAEGSGLAGESKEWYLRVAAALKYVLQHLETSSERMLISELPIIPLADGNSVSAQEGKIFFCRDDNLGWDSILKDVGILLVAREAEKHEDIRYVLANIGVSSLSSAKLQALVIERHSRNDASQLPARDILIAHAVFLFRGNWRVGTTTPSTSHAGFWVASEAGLYIRADQVHMIRRPSSPYSLGQYFVEFRQRFAFLHADYYDAVRSDEREEWLAWLHRHLGLRDAEELVPKLQEFTINKYRHAGKSQLPPPDVLISHMVFLFSTQWTFLERPFHDFWFASEDGRYFRSNQIYYRDPTGQSSNVQYFGSSRSGFPFLHDAYYTAVPENKNGWLSWLRDQFGLWDIPRLVDSSNVTALSADFRRILQTQLSREFLVLLRDQWSVYGRYFDEGVSQETPRWDAAYPRGPGGALRREMGQCVVRCRDGSSRPLCETYTVAIFPSTTKKPEILSLQPLLDVPDPLSQKWQFLARFGVTVKDDIYVYLRLLAQVRERQGEMSRRLISLLYRRVQEKYREDPPAVKKFIDGKGIFVPNTREGIPGWVDQSECVWKGAGFVQKFHVLREAYPRCEQLFTKVLTHRDMDLEVLVSEAETITPATPLSLILDIFKALAKRRQAYPNEALNESLARRLVSRAIFPIDEGSPETEFDDLCTGTPETEWYIADRPHLRASFQGIVSLLSFSPPDVLSILSIITAIGLGDRLLSKIATPSLVLEGDVQLHQEHTAQFRSKSKFIARMLPDRLPRRTEIISWLQELQVFVAGGVYLEWSITTTDSRGQTGPSAKGQHRDHGIRAALSPPTAGKGIKVYLETGSDARLPIELATRLADICLIPNRADLVYFVFSQQDPSYIEQYLDRHGFLESRSDPAPTENDMSNSAREISDDSDLDNEDLEPKGQVADAGAKNANSVDKEQEGCGINVVVVSSPRPDGHTAEETALHSPLEESSSPRPGYTWLGHRLEAQSEARQQASPNPVSAADRSNALDRLSTRERPRIVGTPNVVFVSSPSDLPHEEFSGTETQGKTFPGRAQISQSGNCTVIIATEPDTTSDAEAAFAGELFVSRLLKRILRDDYWPDLHWTSHLRSRAMHAPFEPSGCATTSFTLGGLSTDAQRLFESLFRGIAWWSRPNSVYHIQVQTTVGGLTSPFVITSANFDMARRYRGPRHSTSETDSQVFVLVRVVDLYDRTTAHFYVDPWAVYEVGKMTVQPRVGYYMVEMHESADPDLKLNDFSHGVLQGPKLEEMPPPTEICGPPNTDTSITPAMPDRLGKKAGRSRIRPGRLARFKKITRNIVRLGGSTTTLESPEAEANAHDKPADAGRPPPTVETPNPVEQPAVYQKLPESRMIRILELSLGQGAMELTGVLHYVSLDSSPPFHAISYAWGYNLKPFMLKTPNGGIGITISLYFGLRRLRDSGKSVWLWADAICINQGDDDEKCDQIRLMPEIFKRAAGVLAWVGQEADNSTHVMECLCDMATSPMHLPEESAVWDSINSFFSRPWFQRVWVVQELVLATEVQVICGDKKASWDQIYTAAQICSTEAARSTSGVMKQIAKRVSAILNLGDLRRSYQGQDDASQRRLHVLFDRFQHTLATKPHDKMFALLGVACDALEPEFNPDYKTPLNQVIQRYAEVFVKRGSALELLYRAKFRPLLSSSSPSPAAPTGGLASWIPDWITNMPQPTITTWPSKRGPFSVCTLVESEIWTAPEDNSVLVAKGYLFDRIETVGGTSYQSSDRISYLQELSRIIKARRAYPGGDSVVDLEWKIPIGDAARPISNTGRPVNFAVAYQALVEYLQLGEHTTDWKTEIQQARAMAQIKQFLFRPQELRQLLWPYLHTALEFAERFADAKACATQRGYVGIVPGTAEVGDVVAVLRGSAVPFVIKKSDKGGYYTFLGECYVHGIMHGLALSVMQDLKVEDIRLH